jgi:hypothetical protein
LIRVEPMEDTHGHSSADDEYRETPPGAGYEHTDASAGTILKFLLWLAGSAVLIHLGLALLFNLFVEQRIEHEAPQYPLALGEGTRVPPEPRLQRFPREDIMNFRIGEEASLHQYGWVDRDAGVVQIPIDEAMRLTVERGLPSRQQDPAQPEADRIPADSSAGRTLESRQ